MLKAASLHPWLQAVAPMGPQERVGLVRGLAWRGCRDRCRGRVGWWGWGGRGLGVGAVWALGGVRARAHLPVCLWAGAWSRGWRLWQRAGAASPLKTWGRRGVWSVGSRGRSRLGAPTYLLGAPTCLLGAPTYTEAARACLLLNVYCFLLCALCVLCVEIVFPVFGFSLHA
jgi:hypothetical protein